ncbi:cupin domain-containing protein [Yinghuangia seranimata]|uniref:cupin domain-containing protein n=1 Tax=Yinghuangia seranimata TaxID=408067 RepID=UPI00248AC9B5|nr:cupin domain-containing protein [Yinghuangia seranimata]MDI2129591.1 cupin domain-containing protein [Yinghuangia seranimata]
MQKFSVEALARTQLEAARDAPSGRSATTVVGGHERALRQTVLAMTAGTALAEHDSGGEATVLVLSGRILLSSNGHDWEARQGDLLVVPPAPHSVEALEDAAFVLTVALS